jgi:hypothetical protein
MIKNLVVNGCSYTEGNSWAQSVNIALTPGHYKNLAQIGAGNFYISNSTIDYLSSNNLNPTETLVIVMWSGTGRKDIRISGEWYYHLKNQYACLANAFNDNESEYYLFSGGATNSWITNSTTKKVFEWFYKLSDPVTLCKDTLMHIVNLENYLKVNGYQYRFAGYINQWTTETDHSPIVGDYSIGHFLKDVPIYKNYNFNNWIFVDQQRNCLGEFASSIGELDATSHPTTTAHRLFAEQIIIPALPIIQ